VSEGESNLTRFYPTFLMRFFLPISMSYSKIRSQRMAIARSKGKHTQIEWHDMKQYFKNTCAKCFGNTRLTHVEKDHIIPIYLGGSDSIKNIQPLCAHCNSSKGPECFDYRPMLASFLGYDELPLSYKNPF
jgi:5-methylcytosine-specific restriction endonuclease McrA